MHQSLTSALAAALGIWLCQSPPSLAGPGGRSSLEEGKQRLARNDARGAVVVLESALPGADDKARPGLLDTLREAYAAAAKQAEADGRPDLADDYRDNLQILNRKPRAGTPAARPSPEPPAPPASVGPVTAPADPALVRVSAPPSEPAPTPAVTARPAESRDRPPVLTAPRVNPTRAEPSVKSSPRENRVEPAASAPATAGRSDAAAAALKAADTAFLAERYNEAGETYAALDRAKALPDERRGHWAYCRAAGVVRRINARPASTREWEAIDAEIQSIRALSPSNWFAEYLRNLASERHRDPRARSSRANKKLIVRANSPEESVPPAPVQAASPVPTPAQANGPVSQVPWSRKPVETVNFQVLHVESDRALAERVARAAEAARETQVKRWGGSTATAAWVPRCEIVVFPNAQDFSRETLQAADSPGFSTMGMNAGRIVLRRIHLRADHPNIVKAVLPHEVTHVVLADLFPHQQVPRWADEGMAVLAEPAAEQSLRASDLHAPLKAGRVFRLGDLMVMDYPDSRHWSLYYAQSVSLTRFLVETGTPSQFVRFVQESQRTGFDPALRKVYAISGFDDLQGRWLTYAREQTTAAAVTASATDPEKNPESPRR